MMSQYFAFKDVSLSTPEQVGGKGQSLLHFADAGFVVPTVVVLSAKFFQPWLTQLKATPEWEAFTQTGDDERVALASDVKTACQTLALTDNQQQALTEVRQHFQAEGVVLLAVRSSSPEEDIEGASFAGIYETVLGVTHNALEASIRTCFASILDERVVSYKQARGFDPLDPKIAVVIQKQLAADVSGVAFSLNPMNNCYDECVINANFGLGVTVVDGTITPDQWVVDKVTHGILEKTLGHKDIALYLREDGGTESRAPDTSSEFCLSDEQILAITALTTKVEAEYGKPMDIEWAYEGGQLYLLQARPITTYYRLPPEMITPPGEQKHLYHDANLTEQGLPEDLSPLGEEIFINGSQVMMGADASVLSLERGILFGCAGRTYTNVGRMSKLMGKKNVINTLRIVDDYGGRILDSLDLKEYIPKKLPKGLMISFIKTSLFIVKMLPAIMQARRNPAAYLQIYLAEQERVQVRMKRGFATARTFDEGYQLAMVEVGKFMAVSLPSLLAAERARGKIKKLFKQDPAAIQERIHHIERALPHNVTIEMGLVLYELSQFSDVQECATPEAFAQKLADDSFSPEFVEKWQHFIVHYGFRCPKEADVATARYYERPKEVFALLKTMRTEDDVVRSPRSIFEQAAQQRVESV
jgi:hypothetical protein